VTAQHTTGRRFTAPAWAIPLLPYLKALAAAVLAAVVAVVAPLVQGGHWGWATLWTALVGAVVTGTTTWWVKYHSSLEAVLIGEFNQPGAPTTMADVAPAPVPLSTVTNTPIPPVTPQAP
jgi:hypothetical protein